MKKISGFGFLFSALLSFSVGSTAFGGPPAEVAESVPLETTLGVPGIRSTQAVWLELIQSATQSLDLEEFYISNQAGQSLEPVLNAIVTAAHRGVQVRLIVDSSFYKNYPGVPNTFSRIPNIVVRVIDFSPGIQHAKFFIVDRTSVFEGSANFDWLSLSHIHEVGLRVSDAAISAAMESIFETDWAVSKAIQTAFSRSIRPQSYRSISRAALSGFQVVASPAKANPNGILDTLTAITRLIASAQHALNIQVYQYTTQGIPGGWRVLDTAIRAAAARGVQVQLLVDAVALKSGGNDLKALSALPNIHVRSVTIPQWSGGHPDFARLIHSKYLTVDGARSWVGSENWSVGYFMNTRNVGLVFDVPQLVAQVDQIFDQVWTSAYATSL